MTAMKPNANQLRYNRYGASGDLIADELGRVEHVKFKSLSESAAQKAEKVNLEQRNLLIKVQQLLQAGDRTAAVLALQEYHRKIYPGELSERMLGSGSVCCRCGREGHAASECPWQGGNAA